MHRWIFSIWCVISLVLCLAAAGVWARSHFRADVLRHRTSRPGQMGWTEHELGSELGSFYYRHTSAVQQPFAPQPATLWEWQSGVPSRLFGVVSDVRRAGFYVLGFGGSSDRGGVSGSAAQPGGSWVSVEFTRLTILIPHWFMMVLLALAPARWVVLKRREIRNRPPRLCKTCGYDLRATPDAGGPLLERCPECGVPVPLRSHAQAKSDALSV